MRTDHGRAHQWEFTQGAMQPIDESLLCAGTLQFTCTHTETFASEIMPLWEITGVDLVDTVYSPLVSDKGICNANRVRKMQSNIALLKRGRTS